MVVQMQSLTTVKELQRLTGCIAALGRFMSKLVEKCLPFFKMLKKKTPFECDDEVEKAFQKLNDTWRSSLGW